MSLVFKLIVFISFVCHVNACIYKTWRHYFNLKHFLSVLEKVCIFITCPYTKDRSLLGLFNHCHLWPFHISFTSSQWTFKKRMQFFSKWICFKIRSHVAVFFYVTNSESMKQMHVSCSGMPFQDYNVSSFFLSFFVEKMIEDFNLSRRGELSTKANADGLQYIGFIWFPLDFGLYRLFSLEWRVVISPLQHISFQSGPL